MRGSLRVLHVEDDPDFADVTARFLEREDEQCTVETAATATEGLRRLSEAEFDCIVSDYDMPETSGIEFLEAVREDHPNLPFILFTGKGSEEVASEAISAGVSDYLEKEGGSEQYELLLNRIRNLVDRTRAERKQQRQLKAIETAKEGISILDEDGRFIYVNNAYADMYGYDPEEMLGEHWELIYRDEDVDEIQTDILPTVDETGSWQGETVGLRADGTTFVEDHTLARTEDGGLVCTIRDVTSQRDRTRELQRHKAFVEHSPTLVTLLDEDGAVIYDNTGQDLEWRHGRDEFFGENVFEYIHPDDEERVAEALETVFEQPDEHHAVEFRFRGRDGEWRWLRSVAVNLLDDPMVEGVPVSTIDITERKRREEELERQNERLEEFVGVVGHDLRNPLNIAEGRLELAKDDCDSEQLDAVSRAHGRINELIDNLLKLARSGMQVDERERVDLATAVEACWRTVDTDGMTLQADVERCVRADPSRLRQLVENLVANAVEHGGGTVRIGELDGGFFVEDDGPGIPAEDRQEVFEVGYTTSEDGTGFGLSIVEQVADAHDWDVRVVDGADGGARFEVSDVEFVE